MNEKAKIRKQLIKNMFLNFIIFAIILFLFDFIIYNKVVNSLYQDIDKQLETAINDFNQKDERAEPEFKDDINKPDDAPELEQKDELNPRLVIIERNSDGEITDDTTLGNLETFADNLKFNSSNLNSIYNLQINGEYSYRGINFRTTNDNDETIYIQVLANVDGEVATLDNLLNTLLVGTILLVAVSILVSYLLSRRTIKPIVESYRKQTEFVQNASHELRTPLTIIQAKQELLLTEPDKKIIEKSDEINLCLKETRRLTKLIKELMNLAREENITTTLSKENTDINELIKNVAEPYTDLAKMQEKNIKFELDFNQKINIDKNKINEVLVIILDNAIKYTNSGDTITIKTYLKDGKCNIDIQDTGIGISDEAINHVFDRFYREDKARSRETGGTGLRTFNCQNDCKWTWWNNKGNT